MSELEKMVSDADLKKAFQNANFGVEPREVIRHTLLKRASYYHSGFTSICICVELGLLTKKRRQLTKKGGQYLWEAFAVEKGF